MEVSGGEEIGIFYHYKSIGDLVLQKLTENGDVTAIVSSSFLQPKSFLKCQKIFSDRCLDIKKLDLHTNQRD
jgi:hypothetical protein